ncbi:MAG: hypothetical protein ACLRWP_01010 [Bilophila wadsworthia]
MLTGVSPSPEAETFWAAQRSGSGDVRGVQARRRRALPGCASPRSCRKKCRARFSPSSGWRCSARHAGGAFYKELMDMVDELLFLSLGKAGGCDGSA